MTIGKEMQKGKSIEDAVRVAYKIHGAVPPWKLYTGILSSSPFFVSMGGIIGGMHGQKIGIFNQNLISALLKVSKDIRF